jgi:hypothetical protein
MRRYANVFADRGVLMRTCRGLFDQNLTVTPVSNDQPGAGRGRKVAP